MFSSSETYHTSCFPSLTLNNPLNSLSLDEGPLLSEKYYCIITKRWNN